MITRSDLKPLGGQLKTFWIQGSSIEVIPADLFEDTINLQLIFLSGNKIKHVERGAFSHLQKLTQLFFSYNTCKTPSAYFRADVLSLISTIEEKCVDEEAFARFNDQLITTGDVTNAV